MLEKFIKNRMKEVHTRRVPVVLVTGRMGLANRLAHVIRPRARELARGRPVLTLTVPDLETWDAQDDNLVVCVVLDAIEEGKGACYRIVGNRYKMEMLFKWPRTTLEHGERL